MSSDRASKKQQFNVYLPPELIRRTKYHALDAQSSLSEVVERALALFLSGERIMSEAVGLRLQPMIHVADMAAALRFYEGLGACVVLGSRDGDWVLLNLSGQRISLLAHPPGDGKKETVELQFTSDRPIEDIEARMRDIDPAFIERGVADEAFGRMLKLQTPDGLLVKVVEIEHDLVASSHDRPLT